eukprot:tig00020943_g16278.t1
MARRNLNGLNSFLLNTAGIGGEVFGGAGRGRSGSQSDRSGPPSATSSTHSFSLPPLSAPSSSSVLSFLSPRSPSLSAESFPRSPSLRFEPELPQIDVERLRSRNSSFTAGADPAGRDWLQSKRAVLPAIADAKKRLVALQGVIIYGRPYWRRLPASYRHDVRADVVAAREACSRVTAFWDMWADYAPPLPEPREDGPQSGHAALVIEALDWASRCVTGAAGRGFFADRSRCADFCKWASWACEDLSASAAASRSRVSDLMARLAVLRAAPPLEGSDEQAHELEHEI